MNISVLMSVYKSETPTNLDSALKSIWDDQVLKPDEIVLIQDGPVEKDLANVIQSWKEKLGERIHIIVNDENLGLTKSLNKGLTMVQGKYIARMDSDDISLPNRFKSQYEYLETHSDVAVLGGSLQEFSVENDNLGVRKFPLSSRDVRRYIRKASPLAHPTVMIRKEIFDKGLAYNPKYRTSQDLALWFDVLCAGYNIENLDEVTIKFRREGEVYRRRSKAKAKNELLIYLNGIKRLYGPINFYYLYPLIRYLFRMMPVSIIKSVYGSSLRAKFLQKK